MAKKLNFKLNLKGVNELMKSEPLQALMQEKGEGIAKSAEEMAEGAKFESRTKTINWIAVTNVSAENKEAVRACYEDNVLLKALRSGESEDVE